MIYYLILVLFLFFFSSTYSVGDKINIGHQNMEFDICYGSDLDPNGDGVFQLAELNGDLNGGDESIAAKTTRIASSFIMLSMYKLARGNKAVIAKLQIMNVEIKIESLKRFESILRCFLDNALANNTIVRMPREKPIPDPNPLIDGTNIRFSPMHEVRPPKRTYSPK